MMKVKLKVSFSFRDLLRSFDRSQERSAYAGCLAPGFRRETLLLAFRFAT